MQGINKGSNVDWDLLAGLRFVLAGAILIEHINQYFGNTSSVMQFIGGFGGKAGVIGFFVISGYSIAASLHRNAHDYYKRRFLRIYPLYISVLAATLLLENGLHGHLEMPNGETLDALNPLVALGNAFFLQTFVVKPIAFDVAVWSLAVEVSYYVVAPLLTRLPKWTPLAVIAASALSYALPRHSDWGLVYYVFTRFNMLEWAWAWMMGYYLFADSRKLVLAGFAVLGSLLIWNNGYVNPERFSVITYLASLLAILVAETGRPLRKTAPAVARALGWLGNISYPLYLVQCPIFFAAWGFFGISNATVLIGLSMAGSIGAYYAADVYLKARMAALIDDLVPRIA